MKEQLFTPAEVAATIPDSMAYAVVLRHTNGLTIFAYTADGELAETIAEGLSGNSPEHVYGTVGTDAWAQFLRGGEWRVQGGDA